MDSIIRAGFIYFFLLIILRISGSRTLSELTLFDFILLLIIGDSSQQAITGSDYSIINAVIIIITLVSLDITVAFLKAKLPLLERILDGKPLIIVIDGKPQTKIMKQVKIDENDILESARKWRGIERIDQIKYAILEKDGDITVIAK
jgi:uncharacterized membrane protein YcaP (DUF421 family)